MIPREASQKASKGRIIIQKYRYIEGIHVQGVMGSYLFAIGSPEVSNLPPGVGRILAIVKSPPRNPTTSLGGGIDLANLPGPPQSSLPNANSSDCEKTRLAEP